MDRRTFLAGLAGSAALGTRRGGMVLEAVFGAHLPQTLRIARWPVMAGLPNWLELRAYNSRTLHERFMEAGLFARSGIYPLRVEAAANLTYLIPFDSLAERNRAWTLFDADPAWHRLRSEGPSEVTIYRPCGAGCQPAADC